MVKMTVKKKRGKLAKAIENVVGPSSREQDSDVEEETRAKVVNDDQDDNANASGSDDDLWKLDFEGKSELRLKAAPDLTRTDSRYKGKKTSRKNLEGSDDDKDDEEEGGLTIDEREHAQAELGYLLEGGSDDEEEEDEYEEEENDDGNDIEEEVEYEKDDDEQQGDIDYGAFGGMSDDNGTDEEPSDHNEGAQSEEESGSGSEDESQDRPNVKTFTDGSNKIEKDRKRGREIKRQLEIWDSLLEVRIQLQKMLTKVNQLPQPEVFDELKDEESDTSPGNSCKKSIKSAQSSIANVLDELLSIRKSLIQSNPETQAEFEDEEPIPKRIKIKEYSSHLENQFESLVPYRNVTIEKWNDKTRLAAGGNQKSFAAFELSTLKQIEHILADKSRLIKRTQLKRSDYKILGKGSTTPQENVDKEEEEDQKDYDPEIFDDDDFYHQLLRDLIEKKTDGASGEALGQKWLQLQKLRTKAKKKVDTRASKGRRIRYDIHSKLVNFMAPVDSHDGYQISEEARNELFNSLFK